MKLAQNSTFDTETCHENAIFIWQFLLKLCDNKIKKRNQFLYETVLLLDFRQDANGKESPSLQPTFNFTLYLDKFQNKSQ